MSADTVAAAGPIGPERLSYRTIFSYSSIQFATHCVFTINGVHLLFFYTDTAGLNPALAGYVLALGHLLDAITNPLMGMWSDSVRWRAGRRRPFYIPGCTITAVVWILLYNPLPSLKDGPLFWYMLVFYLLYNTSRTVFYIPWTAQVPDLTPNYDERSRLAAYRISLGIPGDMIGGILPLVLAAVLAKQLPDPATAAEGAATAGFLLGTLGPQRAGFFIATIGIGALLIICGVICYRGTYELPAPPKPPRPQRTWVEWGRAAWRESRAAVSSVWTLPTGVVLVVGLMGTIGTTVPIATFRYVTKYYFHKPEIDMGVILLYQVGGIASVPFWLWLAKVWDKRRAYMVGFLGWLTVSLPIVFCRPDDWKMFLATMVGIGFCGTGLVLVPAAFGPDVVAWNALHRQGGREGFFYGFWGFLIPCGQALASALVGLALDLVGFTPGVVQTGKVIHGILAMFMGIPSTFLGLAAIIFVWYPITREVYQDIRRQLEARAQDSPAG